jgi:hypothetical protein
VAIATAASEPSPHLVKIPFSNEMILLSLDLAYLGNYAYFGCEFSSCDQRSLLECLHFLGSKRTIQNFHDVVKGYLEGALGCSADTQLMEILPDGADHRAAAAGFIADAATALMCFPSTPYRVMILCHDITRRAFVTRTSYGKHPLDAENTPGQATIYWGDVAASDTWNRLDALTMAAILCGNPVTSTHLTIEGPVVLTVGEDEGVEQEFVLGGSWAVVVRRDEPDEPGIMNVFLRRPPALMHSETHESCECMMGVLLSIPRGGGLGHVLDPDGAWPVHVCCMLENGEEACVTDCTDTKIVEITFSNIRIARC